jgi:hypothetical protein
MATTEQVRAARVDFLNKAVVYAGNQQVVCDAINLSSTGMLIAERAAALPRASTGGRAAALQLQRGQFMRVVFCLKASAGRFIDADAVVVRVATERPRRAWGVQFISLPDHVTTEIGSYVGNRVTEAARAAGRAARHAGQEGWRKEVRDVTPADLLAASGSTFGEDGTPLRELYREALQQVEKEEDPPKRRR